MGLLGKRRGSAGRTSFFRLRHRKGLRHRKWLILGSRWAGMVKASRVFGADRPCWNSGLLCNCLSSPLERLYFLPMICRSVVRQMRLGK